jgi:hypothetical protein
MVGLVHSGVTASQFLKKIICGENSPFFLFSKSPKQHGQKELYEKFPKNSHIWKIFFLKKKKSH